MVEAKFWTVEERPVGLPKEEDFVLKTETLPEVQDGDIIIEAEFLSVDPYMRYRIRQMKPNDPIIGSQVAKVIESKNENYPVGTYLVGYPGWRSRTYLTQKDLVDPAFPYLKVPDSKEISRSTALGILGMPGVTAYFGLLEICQPKKGETVLVNGAGGAVGSYVCQIAKIKGCKVIAFAGADDKVEWLKELGIDYAFNYKTTNVAEAVQNAAPEGINCYFDNVGGKFTATVFPFMAEFARISACGAISTYNEESKHSDGVNLSSPFNELTVIGKQLKIEGFMVMRWTNRWMEAVNQLKQWIIEGKLKYRETFTKGFENMPKAFIDLFHGNNFGKAVVEV